MFSVGFWQLFEQIANCSASQVSDLFGSPAVLGSFVASQAASRRKRGPVAFRPRLSAGLAFRIIRVPLWYVFLLSIVGIITYARKGRIFLYC
jgi:hypothetical protein